MRLFKRKGTPHWWATWNDQDGKRHRRSSGTSDRKLAEALAAKWVKEDFLAEHFGKKPEVPFSEALLRYAEAQKRDHPRHFEVSTLRSILYKAYREDLLDTAPKFPRFKRLKPRDRWLTVEEEHRLVACSARHLVPIIRFAVDTGGRLSEILGLDWRNVELGHKRIRFVDTKNGEDRTVRLCDRACATLASLVPKERGPVFTYRGRFVESVGAAFRSARQKATLNDVGFHDLRHTFASRLVQGGVPLYDVMHLMGHKSLDMVQRYAHLAPDYQKGPIQVLNNLGHNLGTVERRQSAAA